MPIDVYENSTPLQRLGALMTVENIPQTEVSGNITNVTQAIQYLMQKMKASGKWRKANKAAAVAAAVGVTIGVGFATAGIGAVVIGAVGTVVSAGIGVGQAETLDKIAGKTVGKGMRAMKAAWKFAKGTKGEHRRQAADVLVHHAYIYYNGNNSGNILARRAFQALVVLFGNRETVEDLFRNNSDRDSIKQIVAEMMRTE